MADNGWEQLLEELPQYLYPFPPEENDGALIQIRDIETNNRVLFNTESVTVTIPENPSEARRLVEILRTHRTTNVARITPSREGLIRAQDGPMWGPSSVFEHSTDVSVPQVQAAWPDSETFRAETAAALVEIFRDSWGASPTRLRYTVANPDGPRRALYGIVNRMTALAPDRPTHRGAAETCTDWDDFSERLEWVFTTLPSGAEFDLCAPGVDPEFITLIEFVNHRGIDSRCVLGPNIPLDRTELRTRMSALGWKWDPWESRDGQWPTWTAPSARTLRDSTLGTLIPRTVATLRDVLGVGHPKELTFTAEADVDDPKLSYLDAELGLMRQRR